MEPCANVEKVFAGSNGRQNGGSSGQHSRLHQNDGPASIPVLARLCASPAAADVAKTQLERFRGAPPLII